MEGTKYTSNENCGLVGNSVSRVQTFETRFRVWDQKLTVFKYSPRPSLKHLWNLRTIPRPRRVQNRETRCFESESSFWTTKSENFGSCLLIFSLPPLKFDSEFETECKTPLKIEADSETETSPEPRDSVFRVRDERLGKFWLALGSNFCQYAAIILQW